MQEMAAICSRLKNTDLAEAIAVPPELVELDQEISVQTFPGIKKYHKATFGANQEVSLWVDSSATSPAITKKLIARGLFI